jgi:hypothetical protein
MRDFWAGLAQFAAWASGLVLQFLVTPAALTVADATAARTTRFAQFVLTVLAGLILVLFWKKCAARHVRAWAIAAAVSLSIGIAGYGAYDHFDSRWTCSYLGEPPVVIGSIPTARAAPYYTKDPNVGCDYLLTKFTGYNLDIWDNDEIRDRHLMLSALFSLVLIALSLSAMFLIQAWRCAGRPAADPN